MIVDSSAIVAVVRKERGWETFYSAIEEADEVRLSAAGYLEIAIVVDSRRDPLAARWFDDFIDSAGIIIVPVTERQARIAREAYRDYGKGSGHRAGLNFGDCFAYALARDLGEPLLYKGTNFAETDVRSALS
jgi:ribonuclease VapC